MIRRSIALLALSVLLLPAPGPSSADPKPGATPNAKARGWDLALAPASEPGRPLVLEGRLMGLPDSLPIRDATIYLYHADAHGIYSPRGESKPRLAGTLHTNVAGGFRVRTILPGQYDGTPHLHYRISGRGIDYPPGTLSLARSHGAGSDTAFSAVPWMVKLPSENWAYVEPDGAGGFNCGWTLYIRRTQRP